MIPAMPSSTTTTAAATADHGEGTAITALHPEIIRTHLLTRLDGPTLASAGAAFTELHALCSEENLWRRLCHSSWPSTANPIVRHAISAFPSGHRSFFSDSFPTIHHRGDSLPCHRPPATELISAVDIFYGEKSIYSKAIVSETVSNWFSSSPFRLELPNTKGTPRTFPCPAGQEKLTLSWILIDPSEKRSVNVSSLKPVGFRQNCFTGDIEIRFATVLEAGGGDWVQFSVVVTCEGKEGGEAHVREASMQVEDMEGKSVNGKESLVIIQEAMGMKRRKRKEGEEKERYEEFEERKRERKEIKERREKGLDLACIAAVLSTLIVFLTLVLFGSGRVVW
ncbi:hypothetical protein DM860_006138 [Cuscuta australis]|uniref:F-box domain-containing protein n=1 Tax=Cuscuta australis TaxID=267555 RepID=A0A328DK90_9ASTE|nr:hypothetical protein DM860_006138 [Cuscuta australis]